jgi:hypothetical protein
MELIEEESRTHHLLLKKIGDRDVAGSVRLIKDHISTFRSSVMACLSDNDLKTGGLNYRLLKKGDTVLL